MQASDVYDADTHLKLTSQATKWCEDYAKNWLDNRYEDAQPADEGALLFDHEEDDTPEGPVQSKDAPPAAAKKSQKKRQLATPAAAASHASSARKKAAPPTVAADYDSEGVIDFIAAAVPTAEGKVSYNIMWEGHPALKDWWQHLSEETARTELSDIGTNKVLQLEDQTEKRLCIVKSYDESSGEHTVHFGNGVSGSINLLTCELGGGLKGKIAWAFDSKHECCTHTDMSLDWSDPEVKDIKAAWDGVAFPGAKAAKAVILALQRHQVYSEETTMDAISSLAELCQWLEAPRSSTIMLARFNCETLRGDWLPGSLVRDCFQVLSSLEAHELNAKLRDSKSSGKTTFADLVQ